PERVVDPGIAVVVVVEGGIPKIARTLYDELDLRVRKIVAEIDDAGSGGVVNLGVPVEVVNVDEGRAIGDGCGVHAGEIFVGEPVGSTWGRSQFSLPII